jgi:S-adenosylmethionine synthetase
VTGFSASLQQAIRGPEIELHRSVRELLQEELRAAAPGIPGFDPAVPEKVTVNGTGNFAVGGTEGDNGLSGKKLVVDAYGPRVSIGGGALSGKDFYKVDRAGALMARRMAKAVVQTGAARECTVTLGVFPGDEKFSILSMIDGNGAGLETSRWAAMFNLSLARAGDRYTGSANLVDVARYGHFADPTLPWERVTFDQTVVDPAGSK